MEITQPIFIIGVGRSGSTVFHRMFAEHPHVAWLSRLCARFPTKPGLNRLVMHAQDYPVLQRLVIDQLRPSEAYPLWDLNFPGFSTACRDLTAADVTHEAKRRIRDALASPLTRKRDRLLVKITGWPRLGFLHEIFDDAKFIHIIRDGRAVVYSMLNVHWWWGWRGPQTWRWGELSVAQKEEWERHNRSFVALAGIEWKILMDALERAKRSLPQNQYLEIRYEELCSDPLGVFKVVMQFCGLEWSPRFEASVKRYALRNTNYKWQTELTAEQQAVLQDVLGSYLARYSYLEG